MKKKKGQEFEVRECVYLYGLVQHVAFEKAASSITEYYENRGGYSIALMCKSRGFRLSRAQKEREADFGRCECCKEDPQLVEDIVRIEKHQEGVAPVMEHLKVQKART